MDALTRMFQWWNQAFTAADGFTEEAFGQYWTEDAELAVNGRVSARGLPALAAHFRSIQARVPEVEIMLPLTIAEQHGDRIFTSHYVRVVADGKQLWEQVMGFAVVRDGRLARVEFTGADIDPAAETPRPLSAAAAAVITG